MQTAALFIGDLPVGPKCARRAGLIEPARKKAGELRLGTWPWRQRKAPNDGQRMLDLFAEAAHG